MTLDELLSRLAEIKVNLNDLPVSVEQFEAERGILLAEVALLRLKVATERARVVKRACNAAFGSGGGAR